MFARIKTLLYGILLIILIGFGGLVYRNAIERPFEPVACPMDAQICPDGTAVGRTGLSCTFAACPSPNVSIPEASIAYAIPDGFTPAEFVDEATLASYIASSTAASTASAGLLIRRYAVASTSTALATIQETAVGGSGIPVPVTSFSSRMVGNRRFTVVSIERSANAVDTAYYLARTEDLLRFDAIDRNINWSPSVDVNKLPAHQALLQLLAGLQGL